ncbi:MAG: aminoacyl-tRNA hydrolase [Candidatus Syntrophopropionicum ammoniitolerans]
MFLTIWTSPGKLRIRPNGGSGGHKGIESIIISLGTKGFARLRIGVGKPTDPNFDGAGYVLSRLAEEDIKTYAQSVNLAVEAIHSLINVGVERAMNEYNRK